MNVKKKKGHDKVFSKSILSCDDMPPLEEMGHIQCLARLPDKGSFYKLVEQIRGKTVFALKPITPQGYDLENFDHAVTFCLESCNPPLDWLSWLHPPILEPVTIQEARDLLKSYIDPFRGEIELLYSCTHALESDNMGQGDIDWIEKAYTASTIDNQRRKRSSNGGSHKNLFPGIVLAVKKLIQDNTLGCYPSQKKLWEYFEKNHEGSKNAYKIRVFKIYFKSDGDKGKLYQSPSDRKRNFIGESAFYGYVKEAKKPEK